MAIVNQYKCRQGHYTSKRYSGKICPTCKTNLAKNNKGSLAPTVAGQTAGFNAPDKDNIRVGAAWDRYQKSHTTENQTPVDTAQKGDAQVSSRIKPDVQLLREETIKKLAKATISDDRRVRLAVANHTLATPKMLDHLSKDPNAVVRARVALHGKTPLKTLHTMADDKDSYVRKFVASNISSTKAISRRTALHLYTDPDPEVRAALMANPKARTIVRFLNENPQTVTFYANRYNRIVPSPSSEGKAGSNQRRVPTRRNSGHSGRSMRSMVLGFILRKVTERRSTDV